MKIRVTSCLTAAAVFAIVAWIFAPIDAQEKRAGGSDVAATTSSGPAPRLPNGKPDFTGIWDHPYVPDMTRNGRNQQGQPELPFTAEGLANFKSFNPANGDENTAMCMPFGLTRSMNSPYPFQIMQNDKYIAFLFEQSTWFHVVPLDGRDHPKGEALSPTWFGNSVGRWDGDTLVIDTIGFNGYTRLDTAGHPHSDQLHLVQTFRRTDADHIAYTMTIDDPKTFTQPWKNERMFTLANDELIEYSCEENNRSLWEGRIKMWTPPWAKKP